MRAPLAYDLDSNGIVDRTDMSILISSLRAFLRASCGNGVLETVEQCDDGNAANGDGCSATCTIENHFICTGNAPSVCKPDQMCGNGKVEAGEQCDDGNTVSGDGCSSTCAVEANFRCTGMPSVCQSYLDFVRALADINHDGIVSQDEALALTFTIIDALD